MIHPVTVHTIRYIKLFYISKFSSLAEALILRCQQPGRCESVYNSMNNEAGKLIFHLQAHC